MHPPTYIFGHRNPDADSICSAIGYAAFKHACGEPGFVPARCGNSNSRIDSILRTFNQPLPLFIGDITPRVSSIMTTEVRSARIGETCSEVLETIDRYDVRNLPVLDASGCLKGTVSIFNMGSYFTPRIREPMKMRHVRTRIDAIARALSANTLHLCESARIQDFYVRVGAMNVESFGSFTSSSSIPTSESIIVVGDRSEIQEKSIEMGVRLLVISGGLEVAPAIVEAARNKGVSLIVSPYDSATTSWIIRCAGFVDEVLDERVVTFSPDTRLRDARNRVSDQYAPLYFVTDANNILLGVFSKTDILRSSRQKIVLVDHNELTQAVPGAREVEIAEIIDHHRLGNVPTDQPILFINRPVGSTCPIIADLFRARQIRPRPDIAGILMSGLISDTLFLQSPTTTDVDRDILSWLDGISPVKAAKLAESIFSSGSLILTLTPSDLVRSDCKTYEHDGHRFTVSQIEELGFDSFWAAEEGITLALEDLRESQGLLFTCLLVTDIARQNSLLVVSAPDFVLAAFSFPTVRKEHILDLPGIVSRKKQVMPYLSNLLAGLSLPAAEEDAI